MGKSRNVVKGLFWKFSERMCSQLVSFFVSIMLARLLTPDDYGAVSLITIFITISNVLITNGFSSALVQKKAADQLDFSSAFFFNFVLGIIIYGVLYLAAPVISKFYDIPELSPALRVLAIVVPIMGINSVQQAYVSRNMLFKKFFYSTLSGTLLSGVLGVILAYKNYGIWALVIQYVVNNTVNMLVLFGILEWKPELKVSMKRIRGLFSYGWKLLCSGLLDTGYSQIRGILIGKLYSSTDLGYYNRGQQYPQLVVTNINTTISSVLFPVLSKSQDNRNEVKIYTRKAIQVSSYIMWPIMAGLGICAEPIVRIMLTSKWLPCVPYLQIACFTYGIWPIHTANLEALKAMGRSDLFLKLEVIKKAIGMIVLLVTIPFGIMTMAMSAVWVSVISAFINAWPNRKILNYSYIEQIKDMLPSMCLSAIMIALVFPLKFVILNDWLLILAQALLGAGFYLLMSVILKIDGLFFVFNTIKKITLDRKDK